MTNSNPVNLQHVKADWLRVKYEMAYVRLLAAAYHLKHVLAEEAKFNPNHDELGRFTTADGAVVGGSGDTTLSGGSDEDTLSSPSSGTSRQGEITSRAKSRSKTLSDAWSKAEPGPNGGRMCSNGCGRELMVPPNSGQPRDWDLSHNPSWSKRTFPAGTTRPDVRDNYQQGTMLECVQCNRAGGNNDGRFSRRLPLVEGDGGARDVAPLGGGSGAGRSGLRPKY